MKKVFHYNFPDLKLCFLHFFLLCFTQIITATLDFCLKYILFLPIFFVVLVSADTGITELVMSFSDTSFAVLSAAVLTLQSTV